MTTPDDEITIEELEAGAAMWDRLVIADRKLIHPSYECGYDTCWCHNEELLLKYLDTLCG